MKKASTIILTIVMFLSLATSTYAANTDIFGTGANFLKIGKEQQGNSVQKADWTSFNDLAGMVWGIGVCAAVCGGMVLGIKYMFSSVEGKADLKEKFFPFIIGTLIILGALTVWKFAVETFDSVV
jgi:hypothetical protein